MTCRTPVCSVHPLLSVRQAQVSACLLGEARSWNSVEVTYSVYSQTPPSVASLIVSRCYLAAPTNQYRSEAACATGQTPQQAQNEFVHLMRCLLVTQVPSFSS